MTAYFLYKQRLHKLKRDIATALDGCDPDVIHDVRVAIRRLAALNMILREAGEPLYYRKEFSVLKNKFREAGRLRDIQVHMQLCGALEDRLGAVWTSYRQYTVRREKKARQNFLRAFRAIHLKSFVPEKLDRGEVCRQIEKTVRSSYEIFKEKMNDQEQLHTLRIAAKKLKYQIEIQQECFPGFGGTEPFRKYLADLQDILGAWHDLEIASQQINQYINRHRATVNDSDRYMHAAISELIRSEKERYSLQARAQLQNEVPLREQVSVVLMT